MENIKKTENAEYVGFKTGEELKNLIRRALFTVCSSEWYENCPYSVMEAQLNLTPVIGSDMGGIPELINEGKTGLLFEAGNEKALEEKIRYLLDNPEVLKEYTQNCREVVFETYDSYYEKLMGLYEEKS